MKCARRCHSTQSFRRAQRARTERADAGWKPVHRVGAHAGNIGQARAASDLAATCLEKARARNGTVIGTGIACATKDYGTGADCSLGRVEIDAHLPAHCHSLRSC